MYGRAHRAIESLDILLPQMPEIIEAERNLMRTFILAALLTMPAAAQDPAPAFLEGFPDVPLIEGVAEAVSERVVFDTPGGTVAQATLLSSSAIDKALESFEDSLGALGWTCERTKAAMSCNRDTSLLSFSDASEAGKNTRIILRLEPLT